MPLGVIGSGKVFAPNDLALCVPAIMHGIYADSFKCALKKCSDDLAEFFATCEGYYVKGDDRRSLHADVYRMLEKYEYEFVCDLVYDAVLKNAGRLYPVAVVDEGWR